MDPEPLMNFLLVSQESGRAEARGEYSVRWLIGGPKVSTPKVRNISCEAALKGGATHLLFADDDMLLCPPDIIGKLLARDKDIIAPLFFRSSGNFDPLVFNVNGDGEPHPILDYPHNELFQVDGGVGTGVILIKREVIEAIGAPYFFYPENSTRGADLHFCMRAIKKGFQVWCDTSLIVKQMGMAHPIGETDFLKLSLNGRLDSDNVR
jgi:GT2 family glycosyltransferase